MKKGFLLSNNSGSNSSNKKKTTSSKKLKKQNKAKPPPTNNNNNDAAAAAKADQYQADQYTLHKQEFDRIVQKYKLDSDAVASAISEALTSGDQISAAEFSQRFGPTEAESVVFLEWIKVGVKFKESSIDTAKQAGLGQTVSPK
mmetsp:Transcript_9945/g.24092  ORF Transcript_9945/g.24092 Transcript_9945/m.24092 type:complete len:144 (+) Transcript_9945:122-553(+)